MRTIPLLHGKVALVSERDYARVAKFHWIACFDGWNWYARRERLGQKPRRREPMHRFILGLRQGDGVKVDHADRNGLNNQRYNLRTASPASNGANAKLCALNKSGFKGVSWKSRNKRWVAQIHAGGTMQHLGLFLDPRDAARAYDRAALLRAGRFALTNKKLGLL